MKKVYAIFTAFIVVSSVNAANFTIDEKKCEAYRNALSEVISHIPQNNGMLDWSKSELISVNEILGQSSVTTENYRQVCSIVMNVLPFFADDYESTLNKILVFSLFHLLKEDIYDFVGSSFYPNDKDLDAITLDGKTLTAAEFIQIQDILEQALEDGVIDNGFFNKTLNLVVEKRLK